MRISGMVFALTLLGYAGNAHADSEFGLNGMFGFGGETKLHFEGVSGSVESDYEPTLGFGVWTDTDMARFLRIGGEARFLWWQSEGMDDASIDRSLTMHFGPTFRLAIPVMRSMDVFFRFAPGFSVAIPSEDFENTLYEIKVAFGFNISGFGGITYRLTDDIGLLAEAGFLYHKVYGNVDIQGNEVDYDLAGTQFMLDFGLFF